MTRLGNFTHVDWGDRTVNQICISIDDVKGIFKVLKSETIKSIFETRTLGFLQEMHRVYGTPFDLYCTYRHMNYSLEDVSEKYRDEFVKNQNWLRFGFHCIEENDKYSDLNEQEFKSVYESFLFNLKRVTGQDGSIERLRLHAFAGNREMCRVLRESGVKILLSSDDNRQNYYLDQNKNDLLRNNGIYEDKDEDIVFISSCKRLENVEDIASELIADTKLCQRLVPIFTHEWMLDDVNVRRRLEECCQIMQKMRT